MIKTINWLNQQELPKRWQDALTPHDFMIPCGNEMHRVRWTPSEGAVAESHDRDATQVVVALGGETPDCWRAATVLNNGKLTGSKGEAVYSFLSWEVQNALGDDDPLPNEFFDKLSALPDRTDFFLRASKLATIEQMVKESFLAWLATISLPIDDKVSLHVEVTSAHKSQLYNTAPLVGLQLTVGVGATTRAVICVTDRWLDEVNERGVVRAGRFFLGCNDDGEVYSHFGVRSEGNPSMEQVGAWGKLFLSEPDVQDLNEFHKIANEPAPAPKPDHFYVGSFMSWSYDDNNYHKEDGEFPACILRNARDAYSWSLISDFKETFINIESLDEYVREWEWEDIGFPEIFDRDRHDQTHLLMFCVRDGINPEKHSLYMTSTRVIPDSR
jgi:hypothetical protein